jgi:hypothetical protein
MPVIFKHVGNIGTNKFEIHKELIGTLKLSNIEMIFEEYGLTKEELSNIKFIANSETLKNDEKSFIVSNDESLAIFVFSTLKHVKEKLEDIFIKNSTNVQLKTTISMVEPNIVVDPYIQRSINPVENDSIPILDDSIVKMMNEKSSKLFENDDFKHLIRIYYSNQDIMKTFLQFIAHGDIVKINIPKNGDSVILYEKEIAIFRSLGIKESDENIKKCLSNFNGHMNLTLRALLCRKAILETSNISEATNTE